MDLRRLVRGSINSVNPDLPILWLSSQPPIVSAAGVATPQYLAPQTLWAQIQPVSTGQLAHLENLNIQGVLRKVYMKGAVAAAVRADGTGGDLLQFPEIPGGPLRYWLVSLVEEQWGCDWCRVIATLQIDLNYVWTADSPTTADTSRTP